MFCIAYQAQVFDAIVGLVTVQVMDVQTNWNWAERCLPHQTMLKPASAVGQPDTHVPATIDVSTATPAVTLRAAARLFAIRTQPAGP